MSHHNSRRRVVVLTGAGISADSGVATFRGAGGLWEGHRVEDVATPQAWARDPSLVWRFYQRRRAQLCTVGPNPAHHALVAFERELRAAGDAFTLVTQNVDDLHQRAGSQPIAMHGEIAVLRCERCGHRQRDLEHLNESTFVPCASCSHPRLRPDVVWFGEVPYHLDQIEACLQAPSHFVAIGTSGVVYPAAGMLSLARAAGAKTFVVALDAPENLDARDHFVAGRAADVVPGLLSQWLETW